jgi:hypothetical protein
MAASTEAECVGPSWAHYALAHRQAHLLKSDSFAGRACSFKWSSKNKGYKQRGAAASWLDGAGKPVMLPKPPGKHPAAFSPGSTALGDPVSDCELAT